MGILDPILGPMLMGAFASVFAYGIMVVQCYLYFIWFKKDKIRVKFTVAFLLLLDTVTVAFNIGSIYNYLVSDFDDPAGVGALNFGLVPYPLFTGLTALVVQCFYGWSIQVLTHTHIISGFIYVGSVVQFLASIGTTIGGSIVRQFALLEKTEAVALVWLAGSLATDLLITATLVVWLRQHRTGFTRSDDFISRIIRLTVQTGFLTTALAICVIATFLTPNHSAIQFAFGIPTSKIYTNSLMSTLNGRRGWIPPNTQDGFSNLTTGETSGDPHASSSRRALRDGTSTINVRTGVSAMTATSTTVQDIELQDTDKDSFTKGGIKVLVEEDAPHRGY